MAKQLATGLMILLSAGTAIAANAPEIRTMAGKDFSRYISYAWAPKRDLVEGHPLTDGSPLDVKIKSAADRELVAKGYQRTGPDGDPSLGFLKYEVSDQRIESAFVPLAETSTAKGYGPGGHPEPDERDYSIAWEK